MASHAVRRGSVVSCFLRKHSILQHLTLSRKLTASVGKLDLDVLQVSVCELKQAATTALEVGALLGQGPRPVVMTSSAGSPDHHHAGCRDSGLTCRSCVGSMRCELHLPGCVVYCQRTAYSGLVPPRVGTLLYSCVGPWLSHDPHRAQHGVGGW